MFYMQVRLDLSFKYIGIPETPLPGMNFIAINVLEKSHSPVFQYTQNLKQQKTKMDKQWKSQYVIKLSSDESKGVISLHQDAEGAESPQRSGSAGERLPSEGENDDDMPEGMHELRSLVESTVTEQIQQVP